ncbi:MAG: SUMF1/EgtB/PvdO family nonheme iron enzyme [Verrucomicrobiota bacterium]|nr:SUMF1/EgtB/PvdO family nonheme iron enzyme [Verrucomicrobiota bacterium]
MNKSIIHYLCISWTAIGLASTMQGEDIIDFSRQVKPILESTCLSCHNSDNIKGELLLDTRAHAIDGGEYGTALTPGDPDESALYTLTILDPDDDDIMPPKGDPLTREQTDILKIWIEQGATWPDEEILKTAQRLDFVADVQPVLELNCVSCHREGHADGDLQLDIAEKAFAGGKSGPAIIRGRSSLSPLYTFTILPEDHADLMPPAKKDGPMSSADADKLRFWIDQGAQWPEGLTLVPRKADSGPTGANMELVSSMHERITSNQVIKEESLMEDYSENITGTQIGFEMVAIKGGTFKMGSPTSEEGRREDEGPQVEINVSPFWMGKYEVTWNEYELFMYPEEMARLLNAGDDYHDPLADEVSKPTKPYVEMSFGMGKDGYPAISMTQHAAAKYCQWLSAKTGHFYRLPTEAEWEYACRAGTSTAFWFGNSGEDIGDYEWYADNADFKYQKVGTKKANPWGLYDMHGNVAEWVLDAHSKDGYQAFEGESITDPWTVADTLYSRSVRGGSWDDYQDAMRSAARRASHPDWKMQDPQLPKSIWYLTDAQILGIRVVRPLMVPDKEQMALYWNNLSERD